MVIVIEAAAAQYVLNKSTERAITIDIVERPGGL